MSRAVRLTLGTTWSGTGCRRSNVASLPEAGWDDERPRVWSVLQPSRRAGRHERGHRPDGGDRRVARTRLVVDGVTVTVSTCPFTGACEDARAAPVVPGAVRRV